MLLLNNDISMINSDWLKEMVRYLSNPEVGIVGPKLLYPDGTLQHAGVVLGIGGVAGHRYAREAGDEPGAFGRLALAQDVSAVTGACLLIRRALFQKLGGLDAANLAVAFNDIDLCMQVRAAGYRIIWTFTQFLLITNPNRAVWIPPARSRNASYASRGSCAANGVIG